MKKLVVPIAIGIFLFALSSAVMAQTLKEAFRYTDNEQFDMAGNAYRSLIAKEPGNGTNYYYLAENYLLSDQPDSALKTIEQGEKADAANPLFSIARAKIKLDKYGINERKRLSDFLENDSRKAQEEFDKSQKTATDQAKLDEAKAKAKDAKAVSDSAVAAVKEADGLIDQALQKAGPKNVQAMIEAADAYIHFRNKNLDKAKGLLEKAWSLDSKNIEIQLLFGDIYSELNNGTLAADYYNRAMEMDKNDVRSIVKKGRLYARSTNYEGAAEEYKNAVKINPDYAPAHRELGDTYIRLGKNDLAKEEFKKFLDLSKNNFDARVKYASFLYRTKDYTNALNEIQQVGQRGDKNNITLLRIAMYSYYEMKDSVKALEAAQNLFNYYKEDRLVPIDYEYYGRVLAQNSQDSLAVEMLRKAYQLDPKRCDLLKEIYTSYDKLKKNAEAAQALLDKIQNCKGATVADYFNMGRSWFFAGEFYKADSAMMKVTELSQKYASGYLWRAKANAHIDSTSAQGLAKPFYEKYIEVAMGDTANYTAGKYKAGMIESYRYLASYAYFQLKDRQKSKEYLKKILEIDPTDQDAADGIRSIDLQEKQEREKREKGSGGNK
jgi:tetratricopeptide (TPR) repeat protein